MAGIAFIDGNPYPYVEGETILSFLRNHLGEKSIPTLCDAPNLKPFGACRICIVEAANQEQGERRVVASCHTQVSEDLYIYPHSEKIVKLRNNILQLVLSEHADLDLGSELESIVKNLEIEKSNIYPSKINTVAVDKSHPYLFSEMNKCINCYRCIRVCDEVQGQLVLSMHGRGYENRVIKGADTTFIDSECVSCGACAQTCPTNAISDVFNEVANQKVRTICTYCGVGCNLDVFVKQQKIIKISAPYNAEVNQGHICIKGRYAFQFYKHPDRLKSPLIKKDGEFVVATWDEAFNFIVNKLQAIKNESGPDSIAGISSSRCTNEENYLMQKFMRAVIGTNNIDGCARVCHSPSALGMQRTFGTGAATNSIDDLKYSDCILVIGANPTTAHPVTGVKIKQRFMAGVPSIVIDPYRTELARYATIHLQLRPGTNVALLNMMFYYIIKADLVDNEFIKKRCENYQVFKESINQLDIEKMEDLCGVDRNLIQLAALVYAQSQRAISFHGLGVTEHSQGTFAVMQIANLAMLTGNIGRRGVGVNPLRGQNNVQGAADMGVQPHQGAGYLDITDPKIHKKMENFYRSKLSNRVGLTIPEILAAAGEKRVKALWIIGEDIVQTDPNSQKVIAQIKNLDLLVIQELFMTETAKYADVILPGASFLEKEGTFTNGERRVQRVNRVIKPIGDCKPDGDILVEIMNRMGYFQADYSAESMLQEISQIVPFFSGITWEKLGENGLQWPVGKDGKGTTILHTDTFKRGRGKFYYVDFKESEEIAKHHKQYPYILTTVRDLVHYNCGAMTRRTDNAQISSEDLLLINTEDARENKISTGDTVEVVSARGSIALSAKVTDNMKRGILRTTFHFPEVMVNNITSDISDSESLCPEYKVTSVKISKKIFK